MWKSATQQINRTSDVSLGARRRFGPDASQVSPQNVTPPVANAIGDPSHAHKRRSRWGEPTLENDRHSPAAAPAKFLQIDSCGARPSLEEINRNLRLNDHLERHSSPPSTYSAQGRKPGTVDPCHRKKLEDDSGALLGRTPQADLNSRSHFEYQPQRSSRLSEKVYIPVKEFPQINFFGLLVGPRGNSLKKMERESGAKISIRGKGSVKEGKARSDQLTDDAEEDLHCLVIADTDEKVAACVKLINRVIETAASTPEGQNDHKRNQLRELAVLNGTLRDDENQTCQSCGGMGHRKYDCTEQRNFNTNIICRLCGGAGHVARDCPYGRGSDTVSSLLSGLSPRTNGYDFGCPMSELGNRPRSGAGDTSKAIGDGGQGSGRTLIAAGPKTFPWQELQFLQAANASLPRVDDRLPSQTGYDSFHSYSHGRQQWEARPSCPTQGLGA